MITASVCSFDWNPVYQDSTKLVSVTGLLHPSTQQIQFNSAKNKMVSGIEDEVIDLLEFRSSDEERSTDDAVSESSLDDSNSEDDIIDLLEVDTSDEEEVITNSGNGKEAGGKIRETNNNACIKFTRVKKCRSSRLKRPMEGSADVVNESCFSVESRAELQCLHESGKSTYCLLYTSPSPRDRTRSRMPSSA